MDVKSGNLRLIILKNVIISGKDMAYNVVIPRNILAVHSTGSKTIQTVKKMVQSDKNILDMIFVNNVCVFGTILKQIDCSFCHFLNHIICFCKSRVMLCFVWQGKTPFVQLFIFIE